MQALITARLKAKLSQADVAASIGTSQACISRYENGDRLPNIKNARLLNKLLGISMKKLRPDIFDENRGGK